MASEKPDQAHYPLHWEEAYRKGSVGWRQSGAAVSTVGVRGRVLELGAGNGSTAAKLALSAPEGCALVCIDVSEIALASFPRRLAADPRVSRAVSDARRLPFRDSSFDFVMARHILTHAVGRDDVAILAEAARVLSPRGRLSVEVFSMDDARLSKGSEMDGGSRLRDEGLVWRFYEEAELGEAMRKVGFKGVVIAKKRRDAIYRGTSVVRESYVARARKPVA